MFLVATIAAAFGAGICSAPLSRGSVSELATSSPRGWFRRSTSGHTFSDGADELGDVLTRRPLLLFVLGAILTLAGDGNARPAPQVGGSIDWISWAPGATILFGGSQARAIRADGSGLRLLVANGGRGSWSPDSRSIAVEYRDGIAVADLGRRVRRVVRVGHRPVWAPAGDRIAYAGNFDGVRVVRRDGSGDHLAIALRYRQNFNRENDWSPDGRQIVFSACLKLVREGDICPDAVYTAELARPRARRRISRGQGTCPDWAATGAIVYNAGAAVVVHQTPEAGARIAVARAVSCAAWSPNGRLFAVEGAKSLIVARADGRARRLLASLPARPTCCSYPRAPSPVWSPDGRWIAVARAVEGSEAKISYRLYVVRVRDGRTRLIARTPYSG